MPWDPSYQTQPEVDDTKEDSSKSTDVAKKAGHLVKKLISMAHSNVAFLVAGWFRMVQTLVHGYIAAWLGDIEVVIWLSDLSVSEVDVESANVVDIPDKDSGLGNPPGVQASFHESLP